MANTVVSTKVIVSNKSALTALYGKQVDLVESAIETLIGADQGNSIKTTMVWLDDAKQMKALNAPVVKVATDDAQNKNAIDGVYAELMPDYLTILGGPDVVAMQRLTNPAGNDGDTAVPSDLPYASASPYSKRVADFINVQRAVSRLPGVTGSTDPMPLINALFAASLVKSQSADKYAAYLGISAEVWKKSTTTTVTHLFGNADRLFLSPPSGPDWTAAQLASLSHFVNCHGGSADPKWYGEDGSTFPVAEKAAQIAGKLRLGMIAAAECCYGAQLYNPHGGQMSLCNTYMDGQAAAFCGSTNIAYGSKTGQSNADLMTEYVMAALLGGATAAEAMLEARHRFITAAMPLNGLALKTLAQFVMFGDSSCQPVEAAVPPPAAAKVMGRSDRRMRAAAMAHGLAAQTPVAEYDPAVEPSPALRDQLASVALQYGLSTFTVASGPVRGGMASPAAKGLPETFHLLYDAALPGVDVPAASTVVIVRTVGDTIVDITTAERKG